MVLIRDVSSFGRLVRDARLARGMTQEELAAAIGASRRWVVKFESDPSTAHLHLALKAAVAVGLSVEMIAAEALQSHSADVFREVFSD